MKSEQAIREVFIDNTIRLIGEGGFEKATTKAITFSGEAHPDLKLNEVYIYRLFGSKEALYAKAFERLDVEFVVALRRSTAAFHASEGPVKDRLYELFLRVWNFLLRNEERFRCYIRYYYSVYFREESLLNHNRIFAEIVDTFSPLFKEETDVKSVMHSVFTMMLDFSVRVYNGDLENTETNRFHIFNMLYCAIMTYLNPALQNEASSP
jgi:AcrR family transcriptional regulator